MPPALAYLSRTWSAARLGDRHRLTLGALGLLHLAALGLLFWTETDFVGRVTFLLAWGLLNFILLLPLRRPTVSASISLILIVILILLSRFKQEVLIMTANFIDVMLIDRSTTSFLLTIFPSLRWAVALAAAIVVPLLAVFWWLDSLRVRWWVSASGTIVCLAALTTLSLAVPMDRETAFLPINFVSQFARSGALAMVDLASRGLLESDSFVADRLPPAGLSTCPAAHKLPHIILVLDESSFDISAVPGVKVPPGYQRHFQSFDGKNRSLLIEGAGGPTWYTEYNVLTGLSARSFGHFAEFVTRIAGGRVTRSLPNALRPCGYHSFSLYPWYGAFLGARYFQKTLGIDKFYDAKDLGTQDVEPDQYYYDYTARLIDRERHNGPMFVLTYLMANHFPWNYRWRPDLAPDWRDLGNAQVDTHHIDEYLRRQELSSRDYKAFKARLRRDFPNEAFLIVRFGDHQPLFAKKIVEPGLSDTEIGRHIDAADPRYFTTYYAVDALNFRPADMSDALDGIDASYLPLVTLEAAGVPLNPTFVEQRSILKRCKGEFFLCAKGAETRRFNRLLIDAGLIKGL
jgi:Sulfatase